ncbi:hypothetical protein HKX48_006175 [Thoreauomyces humboldtii]|nr:hypothetical protein HKX48_006175 [Thoreauomyces humboldtii]
MRASGGQRFRLRSGRVIRSYERVATHFPELGGPGDAPPDLGGAGDLNTLRDMTLTVAGETTVTMTAATAAARTRLMRELVAYFFYSRGHGRATAPSHPARTMCCGSKTRAAEVLPAITEDRSAPSTTDVFKGIGRISFALSTTPRRTVRGGIESEVARPPPPPKSMSFVMPEHHGVIRHRERRISLAPALQLELQAISADQHTPRRAVTGKLPRARGTQLGPWVDHDVDTCDCHHHEEYLAAIAGSPAAYAAEIGKGWTSHAALVDATWDVAVAEGGDFDPQRRASSARRFSGLFDRLVRDAGKPKERMPWKGAGVLDSQDPLDLAPLADSLALVW